eukprot:9434527-Pyramimonas_sp.AAC.1
MIQSSSLLPPPTAWLRASSRGSASTAMYSGVGGAPSAVARPQSMAPIEEVVASPPVHLVARAVPGNARRS